MELGTCNGLRPKMYKCVLMGATNAGLRTNGVLHRRPKAECLTPLLGLLASSSGSTVGDDVKKHLCLPHHRRRLSAWCQY